MRRHMSMDELARDVLADVRSVSTEKTASDGMTTELGILLCKMAEEIRSDASAELTYADLVRAAEVRRAR